MVAGKVGLPGGCEFQEFFDWLTLERLFDFIDAGHRRADAAHFALVLTADDFLENPLDHMRWGRTGFPAAPMAIHQHLRGCKRYEEVRRAAGKRVNSGVDLAAAR